MLLNFDGCTVLILADRECHGIYDICEFVRVLCKMGSEFGQELRLIVTHQICFWLISSSLVVTAI